MRGRNPVRGAVVLGFLSLAGAACSAWVDPDTRSLDPKPMACQLGDIVSCTCLDGSQSTQVCNVGGGFDACQCGTAPDAGLQGVAGATGLPGSKGRGRGQNN
jgi:hypothetical protein